MVSIQNNKREPRQIVQTHVQFLRVTQTSSEFTDFWIPDTAEVPISMFRPFFSFFHSCHDSSLSRWCVVCGLWEDKLLVFVTTTAKHETEQECYYGSNQIIPMKPKDENVCIIIPTKVLKKFIILRKFTIQLPIVTPMVETKWDIILGVDKKPSKYIFEFIQNQNDRNR